MSWLHESVCHRAVRTDAAFIRAFVSAHQSAVKRADQSGPSQNAWQLAFNCRMSDCRSARRRLYSTFSNPQRQMSMHEGTATSQSTAIKCVVLPHLRYVQTHQGTAHARHGRSSLGGLTCRVSIPPGDSHSVPCSCAVQPRGGGGDAKRSADGERQLAAACRPIDLTLMVAGVPGFIGVHGPNITTL